jgi:Na+/H+ antiporter NhaD/arsenite permease-like protein
VKYLVLAVMIAMYALVVIFPGKKSISALAAAVLMLVIRSFAPDAEFIGLLKEAGGKLINWDVLMIFVGSLVIAELFIYSRVPQVIADGIISVCPNTGIGIVAILMMTGIISAFVENVATVLVMAPIALALCAKLKMDPSYFMIGLAVMANLQGTATLVGDPPSMIFADYAKYNFNDFFAYHGKPSIFFAVQIGMISGAVFFYRFFRTKERAVVQEKTTVLSYIPSALLILMIAGLAALSFVYSGISRASGILVIALGLAGLAWYKFAQKKSSAETWLIVKNLDWDTVFFLIGIFVVVGAVSSAGLLEDFSDFLARVIGSNIFLGFVLITLVSVVISGFVDNVPYIIVMLPVAGTLAGRMELNKELYMFALLIGSCLGGNLTPFGASANIVSIGILRKQGAEVNFLRWLKIGLPFTLVTTFCAALFVWVMWR